MQIPSINNPANTKTWLGGPSHHLQKQHIPGYGGHVQGLVSENLHGQPFARITSDCLNDRIERGFLIDEKKRLKTTTMTNFVKEGFPDTKETLTKAATSILSSSNVPMNCQEQQALTQELLNEELHPIDRIPVVGYQGFRPVYMNPVRKTKGELPKELLTTKQIDFKGGDSLSNFQGTYTIDPKNVPVVGYAGFVEKKKSDNMYGKSFRDIIIEAKTKTLCQRKKCYFKHRRYKNA